jgi:hypothetical protein
LNFLHEQILSIIGVKVVREGTHHSRERFGLDPHVGLPAGDSEPDGAIVGTEERRLVRAWPTAAYVSAGPEPYRGVGPVAVEHLAMHAKDAIGLVAFLDGLFRGWVKVVSSFFE